jgi:hypothetical protein
MRLVDTAVAMIIYIYVVCAGAVSISHTRHPTQSDDEVHPEQATIDAVRGTFSRLGFGDKETVCLVVLGHQYGRCHLDVSGYENAWYAFDPTHWNTYEYGMGYMSLYEVSQTSLYCPTFFLFQHIRLLSEVIL